MNHVIMNLDDNMKIHGSDAILEFVANHHSLSTIFLVLYSIKSVCQKISRIYWHLAMNHTYQIGE